MSAMATRGSQMRVHSCKQYSYLGINCESWLPALWRHDSANSIFLALGCNLLYVGHGVFEFLLCRPEGRSFWDSMWANALGGFPRVVRLSSSLHGGEIKGRGPPSAQRNIMGMRRVGARGSSRLPCRSRRGRPGRGRSSHCLKGYGLMGDDVEVLRVWSRNFGHQWLLCDKRRAWR